MGMLHGIEHLLENGHRVRRGECPPCEAMGERIPRDVIHGEVWLATRLADLVHRHDIGVAQLCEMPCLIEKPFHQSGLNLVA